MIHKTVSDISVLQSKLLLAAGVPHGWFDRSLGNTVFRPNNPFKDPEWITESEMRARRAKACAALGLDGTKVIATADIARGRIHSDAVTMVGPADGYITTTPGLPLVLSAADCAQIILYAPDVHALAVIHAGGLGTAKGIVIKTVAQLVSEFHANAQHMIAAIGPTISPDHFVPTQAIHDFTLADITSSKPITKRLDDGRIGYDIVATIVQQLQNCDIPAAHIEVSNIDTYSNHNWYSHERDKAHDMPAAMRRHGFFVALPYVKKP